MCPRLAGLTMQPSPPHTGGIKEPLCPRGAREEWTLPCCEAGSPHGLPEHPGEPGGHGDGPWRWCGWKAAGEPCRGAG